MTLYELISEENVKIIEEEIIYNFELTDNNQKADMIKDLLENEINSTLTEVGCGTNRIVFKSSLDEDVVLKIALDSRGAKDNNLEYKLTELIDNSKISKCYESIGTVAVCEKLPVFTAQDMKENKQKVREVLESLAPSFILNDVGFKEFLNWGWRGNDPVIIDYAYLRPITPGMDFTCHYAYMTGEECGGQLAYTKNFKNFKCIECGCKYSLSEIQDPIHQLMDQGLVISDLYVNNNIMKK